jgi:hypothetical protein
MPWRGGNAPGGRLPVPHELHSDEVRPSEYRHAFYDLFVRCVIAMSAHHSGGGVVQDEGESGGEGWDEDEDGGTSVEEEEEDEEGEEWEDWEEEESEHDGSG